MAAVFPPCSVGGTTLTIRKFQTRFFTAEELVRIGTMTPEVLATVRAAIAANENILISGGTSTGKTTLLNALAAFLPADDRVVLIEDTAELQIDRPNLVRFEARREQAGLPAVTIRELLRATLRHRPDRIIVGEVRGGEAFDLLQALNTGHAGTLSTIHANSAEQALARFASCVVQSGVELPYQAVRYQIADAIDLVLHLGRRRGNACGGADPGRTLRRGARPLSHGACRRTARQRSRALEDRGRELRDFDGRGRLCLASSRLTASMPSRTRDLCLLAISRACAALWRTSAELWIASKLTFRMDPSADIPATAHCAVPRPRNRASRFGAAARERGFSTLVRDARGQPAERGELPGVARVLDLCTSTRGCVRRAGRPSSRDWPLRRGG